MVAAEPRMVRGLEEVDVVLADVACGDDERYLALGEELVAEDPLERLLQASRSVLRGEGMPQRPPPKGLAKIRSFSAT